ncbi:MAG: hypothetical protein HUJ90_00670, partial [Bacteroidales bacterium]|nr:hypothetical protein [Bacteroidales bacterium]
MAGFVDMCKKILTIALLCFFSFALKAQEQSEQDSLVTLLSAEYVRLFQIGNDEYREVGGPAVFMHNGAYLHCDSAIWNLDANVIDAFNNVKVIQDKTLLTSDRLTYLVDEDLAQFRGHLVELSSDNENRLRSNNLDYSTRDSVAVFRDGGAMIDKDGNVMEGQVGTYDSRSKVFSFRSDVTMFLDTLFIKTSSLDYKSDEETAYFNDDTYLWRGTGFMRADRGWYQKSDDLVYFQRNVYGNNPDYEGWCDGVYYWRSLSKMEMDGNVTLQDGGHQMALVAQKAEVEMDTLTSTVNAILTKQPAIIYYGKNENDEPDSLFCAADTLNFYTKRVCDIPDSLFKEGKKLRDEILFDAIMAAEEKAAEDAAKKAREAYEKSAEYKAMQQRLTYRAQQMMDSLTRAGAPVPDSIYTRLGMTPPPA